jgi:hypothetical protein
MANPTVTLGIVHQCRCTVVLDAPHRIAARRATSRH